jgi:hypothetical protein
MATSVHGARRQVERLVAALLSGALAIWFCMVAVTLGSAAAETREITLAEGKVSIME